MASNDFKIGDVVKLKSGSVAMTVVTVGGDTIWCKWFNSAKDFPEGLSFGSNASNTNIKFSFHQIGKEEFPPEALEKL